MSNSNVRKVVKFNKCLMISLRQDFLKQNNISGNDFVLTEILKDGSLLVRPIDIKIEARLDSSG